MRHFLSILFALSCYGGALPKPLPTNNALSLDPSFWIIRFSPGMPSAPAPYGPKTGKTYSAWQFAFPLSLSTCAANNSCLHVDYVQTQYTNSAAIWNASSIQMTFTLTTTGNPIFDWHTATDNTCVFPVHVRFLIQEWQDSMCIGNPPMTGCQYGRWWSNPVAAEIGPVGTFTITVPIDPSQWSSVYGEVGNTSLAALDGWAHCIDHIGFLGMTFGGGCFLGHGTFIDSGTGTGSFVCTMFKLVQ